MFDKNVAPLTINNHCYFCCYQINHYHLKFFLMKFYFFVLLANFTCWLVACLTTEVDLLFVAVTQDYIDGSTGASKPTEI